MNRRFILLLLSWCFCIISYAQESTAKRFWLGVEYGNDFIAGELNDKWFVRQGINNFNEDQEYFSSGNVFTIAENIYCGIKPEYTFKDGRFRIASGLRISWIGNRLGRGQNDYFYLRYYDEGITKYARIELIKETNTYLGIPLEFRCFLFQRNFVGLYAKVGMEFNFQIKSNMEVRFYDPKMNGFKQEVLDNIGIKTNTFYSSFYWAMGIKLGKKDHINYNIEMNLPSAILTSDNLSIIDPALYFGLQFTLQIPIGLK